MGGATTTQTDFIFYNDNGAANAATSKAAKNTNWTPSVSDLDTPFRLRFNIGQSGMDGSAVPFQVYLSVDDGTFAPITTTSTNGVKSVASGHTSPPSDGAATTERLAGSGTFTAGEWDNTGATGSIALAVGEDTELEFCLQLDSANLTGGEKLEFHVYMDGAALDTYTVTPTIASAPTPPSGTIEQGSFRWRPEGAEEAVNDNGAGDWEAALDTDVTLDMMNVHAGVLTRLRVELEETSSASKTITPKLQYRKNGGTWYTPRAWDYLDPGTEIGNFDDCMIVNKETTTDGAATTNILSGSAKTFVAGTVNHDATAASVTLNNQHTELEWAIYIPRFYESKGIVSDGDYFDFRVVESDDTLLSGTYDYPRLTVNIPDYYVGGVCVETMQNKAFVVLSDGTMYMPVEDYELDANIIMLKSTDDGKTWTPVDTSHALAQNDMESFSMALDSSTGIIHCLHVGGTAEYYAFATKDYATEGDRDTWLTGAGVKQLNASIDSTNQTAEIILRGSTLYAFYADLNSTEQVYYRKKATLSVTTDDWGSETSIDTTGSTTDFSGVSAVLGPTSSDIHLFYTDFSNYVLYHRTLDTSDVLGTRHTCDSDMPTNNDGQHNMTNAVAWDSSGTEKAMVAFGDETNGYLYSVIVENDGTPNTRQLVSNSVAVLLDPQAVNSRQPVATLAVDGTTVYCFFADDSTADLWRTTNADGASWGTPTEEMDGVTVHAIRGQVYTEGGGSKVFGYLWETCYNQSGVTPKSGYAGTQSFARYVISAGGVTKTVSDTGSGSDAAPSLSASVPVSDSGSGVDAPSIAVTLAVAEAGSGADLASVSAAVPVNDVGSAVDALVVAVAAAIADTAAGADTIGSLTVDLALSDTAAGADAVSLNFFLQIADAGSGAESIASAVALAIADVGAGGDGTPAIAVGLTMTDAGSGADSFAPPSASVPVTDTASGADSVNSYILVSIADAGSASDVAALTAVLTSISDTAAGLDVPSVQVSLGLPDAGSGSDSLSIAVAVPLSDSASALDAINITTAEIKAIADAASGSDSVGPISVDLVVADTAAGSEALPVSVSLDVADTGSAADALDIITDILVNISDTAAGAESVSDLSVDLAVADAAAGADGFDISVTLSVTDSGSAVEALPISVSLAVSDAGSAADALNVITDILVNISDTAAGSDSISDLSVGLAVAESGAGSDAFDVSVTLSVTDSGSAVEALDLLAAELKAVTDSATGSDAIGSLSVNLAVADMAAGSDAPQIDVSFALADAGSGADAIAIVRAALKTVSDTGSGLDALTGLSVSLAVADAGAGAEALAETASVPVAETAVAAEQTVMSVTLSIADTAAGADTLSRFIDTMFVVIADSATGSDAISWATPVQITFLFTPRRAEFNMTQRSAEFLMTGQHSARFEMLS
jgi:hypothetical protein